jgi:hypothetical protein
MANRIDSLAGLRARIVGNVPAEIMFELLLVPDYEAFVRLIDRSVDHALGLMAENPELHKKRSEDELTIELINLLRMLNLDATHETKAGGHCDITIKGTNNYSWMAEAKKHKNSYPWLYQGYQQLATRYTTGNVGQDSGALIIYSYAERIDQMMARWKAHLAGQDKAIAFEDCSLNPACFISMQEHARTGRPLRVRHVPLSLYFDPKD